MSRALRDIPAVRALAARDAFDLMQRVRANRGMLSDHAEAAVYEGVLDLLTDLTRSASRFALAGLIADAGPWSAATVMVAIELGDARRTQLYSAVGLYDPGGPPNPAADMERLALHVLGGAS